jgi:hypothetical protein
MQRINAWKTVHDGRLAYVLVVTVYRGSVPALYALAIDCVVEGRVCHVIQYQNSPGYGLASSVL